MSFKRNLIGFSVIYVFAATTVVAEGINGLFTWSLSDPETGDWFAPATNPCIASMASLGDKTLVLRTFLNLCDGFKVGMQVYQSTTFDFSLSCTTGNSVTDASISWTDDSSGTNYSHQLTEGSEVLSNVVDGKRAHPTNSGCLLHFTVDKWHPLDDLGDELVAPESAPVFLRIGGQFEYHGECGCT